MAVGLNIDHQMHKPDKPDGLGPGRPEGTLGADSGNFLQFLLPEGIRFLFRKFRRQCAVSAREITHSFDVHDAGFHPPSPAPH